MAEPQTIYQVASPLLASLITGGLVILARGMQGLRDRRSKFEGARRDALAAKKDALFDLVG